MKIKWNSPVYSVTLKNNGMIDLTVVSGGTVGLLYPDYDTKESLDKWIENGSVQVVEEDKPEAVALKIEVDTAPLEKAVELAKELEATLLRVKGLLA